MLKRNIIFSIGVIAFSVACGGGGGNGTEDPSGPAVDGTSGKSGVWFARAAVAQNGCGERIAPVTQRFGVTEGNGTVIVDTTVVRIAGVTTSDGLTASFQESNGDCVRDYEIVFSNVTDSVSTVNLTSRSSCAGQVCENKWSGTATKEG